MPLVLGSLWFGMKGAVYISLGVSVLFLPHAIRQWEWFSLNDFHRLSEGVLYIGIALILGFLVEREKKKQRALARVGSLAAVGKAVSEIAHDMKTPLMAVGGFAKQVFNKLEPDNPDRKKLGLVIQEAAHLESMVKEMLDFGKPVELQFTEIDFNALVSDSVRVTKPMAKENGVELETDLASSLPSVFLDAPRVKQILLNLITNAIQASHAGDRVRVCTRQNSLGIMLEVADHGEGIAKKYRESIFHPFFSTKREGTGLGLGIVKKIVETHGGDVSFRANQEKGVTFTVWLPLRLER